MLKLALVGRGIAHSMSKEVYKKLLSISFQYDLLDYVRQEDIPPVKDLFKKFDGINITSPYKKHFLPEIKDLTSFGIVNVLRDSGAGFIEGINTDALAVEQIIDRYINSGVSDIRILGSGAMAEVCKLILDRKLIKYKTYSRKQKNLGNVFEIKPKPDFSTLLINTCSRDFIFKDSGTDCYHFWDMNYQMTEHQQHFLNRNIAYFDGLEQLELQAKYALSFWNFTKA